VLTRIQTLNLTPVSFRFNVGSGLCLSIVCTQISWLSSICHVILPFVLLSGRKWHSISFTLQQQVVFSPACWCGNLCWFTVCLCVWPGGPSDHPSPRQPGGQSSSCYDNPECYHDITDHHLTSAVLIHFSRVNVMFGYVNGCDKHTL